MLTKKEMEDQYKEKCRIETLNKQKMERFTSIDMNPYRPHYISMFESLFNRKINVPDEMYGFDDQFIDVVKNGGKNSDNAIVPSFDEWYQKLR